ncbi:hypothetical protein L3Q67_01735 [Saccharothrix sp. AJ9571]|nr:hypothetical protein L3Q67_01735 [Saccharothrix sp. AJ9571]
MSSHTATPGEHYIALADPTGQLPPSRALPARIDHARHTGHGGQRWIRPRLRPDVVAEALALPRPTLSQDLLPAPPDTPAAVSGPVIARLPAGLTAAGAARLDVRRIEPDADGLYPLSGHPAWTWELTVPDADADDVLTRGRELLTPDALRPQRGERAITFAALPTSHSNPSFPARLADSAGRAILPQFRRSIADALAVWLNQQHLAQRGTIRAYWERDELVLLDDSYSRQDGYLPDRVSPDPRGLYRIGWHDWLWSAAQS